jgi:OOP family OmpA-OmpF porin
MSSRSSVVLRHPRRLGPLALATAALAAGGASSAHAQNIYGGVDLGHPQYSSAVNGIGGSDGSNGGIGAKVYGGYTLTPNFALEGSLFRLGNSRSNGETVNTWGVGVDGVGSYAFAPQWSVLGRVGVAEARFNTSAGNDSSAGVKLGAGLQYDLTKQVALRVQYERYHFFSAFDDKPNVGEYTAGVKINF